jgi:hypothetical protein
MSSSVLVVRSPGSLETGDWAVCQTNLLMRSSVMELAGASQPCLCMCHLQLAQSVRITPFWPVLKVVLALVSYMQVAGQHT